MTNLPLIIGGAVVAALLVAIALITDTFRQRNNAAQETLASSLSRLKQSEAALQAEVTALKEQLAARDAAFEKQAAELTETAAQNSQRDGTIAALEKSLAQEKQAAADYRQTFDAQLADNDRLHASLALTVSEIASLWQKLRSAATGNAEASQNEAAEIPGSALQQTAQEVPQPLAPEEPPADTRPEVLDLETEAAEVREAPVEQAEPEAEPVHS